MEERSPKADGRTGERWGISGLRLGEQCDPCWRLHLRNSMEEIDILLSPAKASQELSVSV